jgi:hypothetical protein
MCKDQIKKLAQPLKKQDMATTLLKIAEGKEGR